MSILSVSIGILRFLMLINSDWFILFLFYRETSPRNMSRLTKRSAIEICTIYHTANKAHVKVIEACRKTVFVLSQLIC